MIDASQAAGHVAIVGSGPSGCYTALALKKAAPSLQVTVIDHLPTPYGLVRHGIAPDHQGTKGVAAQFSRLFQTGWAQFVGNVRVGSDVTVEQLLTDFDVVVLATGLPRDRPLGIPGQDLAGVVGAGALIRYLNGHPDGRPDLLDTLGKRGLGAEVVVLGTGNVAVDVTRLVAKRDDDLAGSDIDDDARHDLRTASVRRITILGRGDEASAKWDPSMLKELAEVPGVSLTIAGRPIGTDDHPAPVVVNVRFGEVPASVTLEGDRLVLRTRRADGTAAEHVADSIVSAIGFIPDDWSPTTPAAHERILAVGGAASGVLGNLAANRRAAQAVAQEVIEAVGRHSSRGRLGVAGGLAAISQRVDHDGWLRIDSSERTRAAVDRCRRKFTTRQELLVAAGGAERS